MTKIESAHPVPEEEAKAKELIVYTRLRYVLFESVPVRTFPSIIADFWPDTFAHLQN